MEVNNSNGDTLPDKRDRDIVSNSIVVQNF